MLVLDWFVVIAYFVFGAVWLVKAVKAANAGKGSDSLVTQFLLVTTMFIVFGMARGIL